MARSHDFGTACEDAAARHLARAGWQILARNYRLGHREIDLVARSGAVVAFVEVKGRSGTGYGHPLDAVTPRKRREIERVARQWIARFGRPGDVYRFDAVAVRSIPPARIPVVEHVADAWRAGGGSGTRG
jgi:putative endonuclease